MILANNKIDQDAISYFDETSLADIPIATAFKKVLKKIQYHLQWVNVYKDYYRYVTDAKKYIVITIYVDNNYRRILLFKIVKEFYRQEYFLVEFCITNREKIDIKLGGRTAWIEF